MEYFSVMSYSCDLRFPCGHQIVGSLYLFLYVPVGFDGKVQFYDSPDFVVAGHKFAL